MSDQETPSTKQGLITWAPHFLIIGGVILVWISLDPYQLVTYTGFLLYGLLSTWNAITNKYYQSVSLKLLKLLNGVAITALTIFFFVMWHNVFFILLMLMMCDNLILTNERIERSATT